MDIELLKSLIEAGNSTRQIASQLNCGQTNVRYWLKKLNLETDFTSRPSKSKIISFCKACKKQLLGGKQYRNIFCGNSCQNEYQYMDYIQRWKAGIESGQVGRKKQLSNHIRRWMFETRNNKCEECGWSKVNEHTGKIPLQIDHIDGNFINNRPDNLKLLCPCCHSLTSTWGGANNLHPGRRALGCM